MRGWFKAENAEKHASTGVLVGCTREEFRAHIENQWLDGMDWGNYGEWHIDHIKPLSWFDPHIPVQAEEALNWKNCQPMWKEDNLQKGNRRSGT